MLPDGIYIGLHHQTYIDEDALGSGDLKDLLLKPVQWHGKNRNAVWKAHLMRSAGKGALIKSTIDQDFGTALHAAVLEPDEFDTRYMEEPEKPDWPETIEEIRIAIQTSGNGHFLPKPNAGKSAHLAAARAARIKTMADWDDELKLMAAGRICISAKWKFELLTLQRAIEKHSSARKFVSGGRSEVSVIWTDEHGHRYKCRFDHLRIRTVANIKTYGMKDGLGPVDSFFVAVHNFAYDFSATHYIDARMNILPRLVAAGAVFECFDAEQDKDGVWNVTFEEASDTDMEFMRKVAAFEKPAWVWIACLKFGVPEVDVIELPMDIMAWRSAEVQVEVAKQNYRDMRAKFGDDDDVLWVQDRGHIVATDFNFSQRATGRGEIKYDVL